MKYIVQRRIDTKIEPAMWLDEGETSDPVEWLRLLRQTEHPAGTEWRVIEVYRTLKLLSHDDRTQS